MYVIHLIILINIFGVMIDNKRFVLYCIVISLRSFGPRLREYMHQKKALGQSFFLMHIFPQNFNEINVSFQNDIGFFGPVPKYWATGLVNTLGD